MRMVLVPDGNFYVLMLGSLACLSTLLTWLLTLVVSTDARRRFAEHRKPILIMWLLLALGGLMFPAANFVPWSTLASSEPQPKTVQLTLDKAMTLAGIDMPAGSRLDLDQGDAPSLFRSVVFPSAITVNGVTTTQIFRYRQAIPEAPNEAIETLSLVTPGDQTIDGWICSHKHRIELSRRNGLYRFKSCYLATGNLIGSLEAPIGSWLQANQANAAALPDAGVRWRLRTQGSQAIVIGTLPLLKAELELDAQRHILSFEGLLAQDLTLGNIHYPAGTQVNSTGPQLADAQDGDVLLSPLRSRPGKPADGPYINEGTTVLHAKDGAMRRMMSNREAGVLNLTAFRDGL